MQRRKRSSPTVKDEVSAAFETLPYGGKVILAKRKKADGWLAISVQVIALSFALFLVYACYFHPSTLQFYVTWFYAHLGYDHAQHLVGQKYLQGYGVDSNAENAIFWMSKAADQGHPAASYDLAVAHLRGMNTSLQKDEAHRLIRHAANRGLEEAKRTLEYICSREDCANENPEVLMGV